MWSTVLIYLSIILAVFILVGVLASQVGKFLARSAAEYPEVEDE